jgi:hypothetical protein
MEKFWMVSVDGGNAPTKRYASFDEAKAEAARLATKESKPAHVLGLEATATPTFNVTWNSTL